MEAIGIAASFIAIGQALLAGRHVIESLRAAVEAANTQGMIFNDNEIEGPDLRLARGQITDIANRLDKVRLKCTQVGQNGKIKPKMARWFWMQKELQQCRDKARDARSALQLALVTLNLKGTVQMSLHIERFTLRSATHHDLGSASDVGTDALKGDDALSSASTFGNGFRNQEDYAIPGQVQTRMRQLSLLPADGRPSDQKKIVGMDMVILEARFPGAGRCPQPCRCRCHSSRPSAVRYPSWIGTLIGSLSVTYDQRLLLGGHSECTELGCKGNRRSSATFGYQLPAWLCARFVSFQVYTDSFREVRSSLRSVRVVPNNDQTLLAIELHDKEAVWGSMLAYGRLLPDDRDAVGNNIMSNFGVSIYARTLIILHMTCKDLSPNTPGLLTSGITKAIHL
ncbi:Pfs domain-containing protein [Colletotrichum asianum]